MGNIGRRRMRRLCALCREEIATTRLLALPTTTLCIRCVGEVPKVEGFMTWEHKTAPTINITAPGDGMIEQYRKWTRRGVHAQLPFSSKSEPFGRAPKPLIRTIAVSSELAEREIVLGSATNILHAKCHPDRPRVNPQGKCLECALHWYKVRRK